jgi:hypothetical protein
MDAAKRVKDLNAKHQEETQEAVDENVPPDPADSLKSVTVTISATQTSFKRGEPVKFTHRFKNMGAKPVVLLQGLDGSAEGLRGPQVFLEVKDAEGKPVPQKPEGGRCGNMNQLKASDFFTLKLGEFCDPFALEGSFGTWPLKLEKPGKYAVTLVYRLKEPFVTDEKLNGPVSDEAKALLEKLPRGELRSNTITVEVAE